MKTDSLVLIIILIFILLPSKSVVIADNKYQLMTNEGIVAIQAVQSIDSKPEEVPPTPNGCTCNGTKKETSGDGLHTFDCRCGENCKCAKQQIMPETTGLADEIVSNVSSDQEDINIKKQTLYFTADWCTYCHLFDKQEVPLLEKAGWVVSFDKKAHIRKIDITKDGEKNRYYLKFGKNRELPLFIHIENNTEKSAYTGYPPSNAYLISNMWYK